MGMSTLARSCQQYLRTRPTPSRQEERSSDFQSCSRTSRCRKAAPPLKHPCRGEEQIGRSSLGFCSERMALTITRSRSRLLHPKDYWSIVGYPPSAIKAPRYLMRTIRRTTLPRSISHALSGERLPRKMPEYLSRPAIGRRCLRSIIS